VDFLPTSKHTVVEKFFTQSTRVSGLYVIQCAGSGHTDLFKTWNANLKTHTLPPHFINELVSRIIGIRESCKRERGHKPSRSGLLPVLESFMPIMSLAHWN